MRDPILILLVWVLSCSPAFGQRVFATVELPEMPDLTFDVNEFPLTTFPAGAPPSGLPVELNFSPNVVFTPDSSRAFVSFPGSNQVMVFDPRTGDVVALIPVGENPGLLTLTPDGRKIGVVSVFLQANLPQVSNEFKSEEIGSISVIDVETLEVRTLELTEVFFSQLNNIVFSADSKTGFVASSGTDQVIRFDVDAATEIAPRLEFPGGTRPSLSTMAPDFSFFAVVLVGSSSVVLTETPDSIQIIDTGSFRVIQSIVPEPVEVSQTDGTTVQIPHNFFGTNNVAFSDDGKLALIADQENSSSSPIPELTSDHALLIDVEQGTVTNVFNIGGIGGEATFSAPSGLFVVLTAVDIDLIHPETLQILRSSNSRSSFRPTSRPAFSRDGSMLFVSSPILDVVLALDVRNGAFRNSITVGSTFDSSSLSIPAGPLDLTMSPDGQVLTSLNFNANTIDLLKNTSRITIPEFLSTPDWFTGVALTNHSEQEAELIAGGVSEPGFPFSDDPTTEDVVEFVNPKTLLLKPGEQTAFTAAELLEAPSGQTIEGWLDLDTDVADVAGFFLTGDPQGKRMDGGLAVARLAEVLVLPEVQVRDGFRTELILVNSNLNSLAATVTLVDSGGEQVGEFNRVLASAAQFSDFVIDPDLEDEVTEGLFSADDLVEGENYYLVVRSDQGLVAYERFYDQKRMAALNGIPLVGPDAALVDRLFATQVVVFGGADSLLNLINFNTEPATVTLTLRADNGEALSEPVVRELASNQLLKEQVADLFQLPESSEPVSGWIEVKSTVTAIVGDVNVRLFSGRAMSAIPLQFLPSASFIFPHIAEGLGFSTGVSLLNTGASGATVGLSVHLPDGELIASRELQIGPGEREVKLLSEWFQGLPEMVGGYIRVEADQPIVGLELFFTNDTELLATVPASNLN
ncbi:MAG: hypothetical protein ACE5JX_09580 [Acidobacteriota bacterium]